MTTNSNTIPSQIPVLFSDLNLPENILKAVNEIGYETATPIQSQTIPLLLAGHDILGLAQTGSGKTASFLLPLLTQVTNEKKCQLLVLAPTRELAIQVSKAGFDYAKYLPDINVLAVYGGQDYHKQIPLIKKGAQIIVATPGRLIDLLDRKALSLDSVKHIVLDEADEMLSMGFSEDLENILGRLSEDVQTALFSATMPKAIEKLTKKYLKNPVEVKIKAAEGSKPDIQEFFWLVDGYRKNEAVVRFLESETYNGAIIFTNTKNSSMDLASHLEGRGFKAAALNGDMNQDSREHTLNNLRKGRIDILIATDVAARGLDVDRLDLVINYDPPNDEQAYVHRIGRTGRAGRSGRAIMFITAGERSTLYRIEQSTDREMKQINVPSNKELEGLRRKRFRILLEAKLNDHTLNRYEDLVDELIPKDFEEHQVLGALLKLATNNKSLILGPDSAVHSNISYNRDQYRGRGGRGGNNQRGRRDRGSDRGDRDNNRNEKSFFISIGRAEGIEPSHILSGLTKSTNINGSEVGKIRVLEKFSLVSLPSDFGAEEISRFTNYGIKGMRFDMRLDNKPAFEGNGRRSDRGGFRGDRGDRGSDRGGRNNDRGGFRGERSGGDRGDRGGRNSGNRSFGGKSSGSGKKFRGR